MAIWQKRVNRLMSMFLFLSWIGIGMGQGADMLPAGGDAWTESKEGWNIHSEIGTKEKLAGKRKPACSPLSLESSNKKAGEYSLRVNFKFLDATGAVVPAYKPSTPCSISDYEELRFWIYNPYACEGAGIDVYLRARNKQGKQYTKYTLRGLNFSGWRQFCISIDHEIASGYREDLDKKTWSGISFYIRHGSQWTGKDSYILIDGLRFVDRGIAGAKKEFGVDILDGIVLLQSGEETFIANRFTGAGGIKAGACRMTLGEIYPVRCAGGVQKQAKIVIDEEERKVVEIICPLSKKGEVLSDKDIKLSLEIRKNLPCLFVDAESRNLTKDSLPLALRGTVFPLTGFKGQIYWGTLAQEPRKLEEVRFCHPPLYFLPEGMKGLGVIAEGRFSAERKHLLFLQKGKKAKAGGSFHRKLILIPVKNAREFRTIYEKNKDVFISFLVTGAGNSSKKENAGIAQFNPPAGSDWIKMGKEIENHGLSLKRKRDIVSSLTFAGRECKVIKDSGRISLEVDKTAFEKKYRGKWMAIGIDYFDSGKNVAFGLLLPTVEDIELQQKYSKNRKCLLEDSNQWKRRVFLVHQPTENKFSFSGGMRYTNKTRIIVSGVFAKPISDEEASLYVKSRRKVTDGYNKMMLIDGKTADKLELTERAGFYLEGIDRNQAKSFMPKIGRISERLSSLQSELRNFRNDYDKVFFEGAEKLAEGKGDEAIKTCSRAEEKVKKLTSGFQKILKEIDNCHANITKEINSRYAWFPRMRFKTQPAVIFKKEGMITVKDMGKHIFMGAQQCETWPQDDVTRDSLSFEFAGTVFGAGARVDPFPEPGKFDFYLNEKVLAVARKKGLRLAFNVPYGLLPFGFKPDHWFVKKYKEDGVFATLEDGSFHKLWGKYYIADIRHPVVRKLILSYLDALGRHFKDEPYLFHYVITNEGLPCKRGGPATTSMFQNCLRKKFKTIDSLNKTLGVTYTGFGEITPYNLENKAMNYQWERFARDSYIEYLKECKDTLEKADPNHPSRSWQGAYFGDYLRTGVDLFYSWIKMGWKWCDMHTTPSAANAGYSLYRYARMKDKRAVLADSEYYWHKPEGAGAMISEDTLIGVVQRNLWTHFLWGKRVFSFYLLNGPSGGINEYLLEPKYEDRIVRYNCSRIPMMKQKLEKFSRIQWESEVKADAAMLISAASELLLPQGRISKEIRILRRNLFESNFPFFYIPEIGILNGMEDLSQYKTIIIPYEPYFKAGLADKLLEWVKNGGVLIASGPPGAYNQYLQKDGKILKQVFGIEELEEKDFSSAIGDFQGLLSGNHPVSVESSYRIAEIKNKKEVEILAMFTDKTPAVLYGSYGRGKVYLSLVPLASSPTLSRFMVKVVEEAIPIKYAACNKGRVELVIREGGRGERYLFAINHDPHASIKTKIKVRGEYKKVVDLDAGCVVKSRSLAGITKFKISLQPGGGTVFRLAK